MYTLYVIPGSHACRSAILMLEHKRAPYRRVDIVTLAHPVVARFGVSTPAGRLAAPAAARTTSIRFGDLLGTVPALAAGDGGWPRIARSRASSTSNTPRPPLFPEDAHARRAVEEAERWANETLQMAARRVALAVGRARSRRCRPARRPTAAWATSSTGASSRAGW